MDRNSNKWYGDDQIVIRGASIEDAVAIMQIWNNNISNTFNTFNSRIKTEAEIIDKILESTKRRFGFFVSECQGEIMGFATYFQFRNGVGYEKTLEHTIVISIGESTIFNIRQDSVCCYARDSKCRNRGLTIGEETIFECSAWQFVRRQKSMIFKFPNRRFSTI